MLDPEKNKFPLHVPTGVFLYLGVSKNSWAPQDLVKALTAVITCCSSLQLLTSLCLSPQISSCFSSYRACARKCSSSKGASTSTWRSFPVVSTKGSCLFLMSAMPYPTTVIQCQVGQHRLGPRLPIRHVLCMNPSGRQASTGHVKRKQGKEVT